MITQRQRGFLGFYTIIVCFFAVLLLPVYEQMLPFIPEITVLSGVDLFPYVIAVFLGMLASSSQLRIITQNERLPRGKAVELAIKQSIYVSGFIFALVFASKDFQMSRLFLGTYLILLTVVLCVLHIYLPKILSKFLFPEELKIPMLLVGRKETVAGLGKWIEQKKFLGMPTIGYLDDEQVISPKLDIPWIGKIEELGKIIGERGIKQVVLTEWNYDSSAVEKMIEICEAEGCRFLIHNNYGENFAREFIPINENGEHFLALRKEPLEDPFNRATKRMLDLAVSIPVVLFILPPLCLWVWVMQKIQSPGKLFFVRPRGGLNWRQFNMLKFRSMRVSNDDNDIANQAKQQDPRIYKFGVFLRKTSLDEFPQFINVLKGEMSVVGPRPHLIQHDREFCKLSPSYRIRSLIKPGLTGLAQVNGFRGEITDPERLHKRVYWDLYYVNHWSIWMDLKIILQTAKQVLFPPKTAY